MGLDRLGDSQGQDAYHLSTRSATAKAPRDATVPEATAWFCAGARGAWERKVQSSQPEGMSTWRERNKTQMTPNEPAVPNPKHAGDRSAKGGNQQPERDFSPGKRTMALTDRSLKQA